MAEVSVLVRSAYYVVVGDMSFDGTGSATSTDMGAAASAVINAIASACESIKPDFA